MQPSLIKVSKYSICPGVSHLRVVLEIEGPFQGCTTQPVNTIENGDAYVQHKSAGPTNLFLDGKKVGKMKMLVQATFYV
jgi:hypothetical protein